MTVSTSHTEAIIRLFVYTVQCSGTTVRIQLPGGDGVGGRVSRVVEVWEGVLSLISIHHSPSFFSDGNGFFYPPSFMGLSGYYFGIFPNYDMIFLDSMISYC